MNESAFEKHCLQWVWRWNNRVFWGRLCVGWVSDTAAWYMNRGSIDCGQWHFEDAVIGVCPSLIFNGHLLMRKNHLWVSNEFLEFKIKTYSLPHQPEGERLIARVSESAMKHWGKRVTTLWRCYPFVYALYSRLTLIVHFWNEYRLCHWHLTSSGRVSEEKLWHMGVTTFSDVN